VIHARLTCLPQRQQSASCTSPSDEEGQCVRKDYSKVVKNGQTISVEEPLCVV
jgi:hypothetical protein